MVRHVGSGKGLVLGLSGLLLGAMVVPASAGVVTLDSQTRSVEVSENLGGFPPQSLQQNATGFGTFNASVSSQNFSTPIPGALTTVSQGSSMTVSSDGAAISVGSGLGGSITENPLPAQSIFEIQFTLTEAAPFNLTYSGVYGDARELSQGHGVLVHGSFTGPGAPGTLVQPSLNTPLTLSGTLQPGTFEVNADLDAQANTGGVNLTLNIGPAIAPSAVPLPPAIWTMLATLPLLGLAVRQVRRSALKS